MFQMVGRDHHLPFVDETTLFSGAGRAWTTVFSGPGCLLTMVYFCGPGSSWTTGFRNPGRSWTTVGQWYRELLERFLKEHVSSGLRICCGPTLVCTTVLFTWSRTVVKYCLNFWF